MNWTYPFAFLLFLVPVLVLIFTVAWFRWKTRVLAEAGDPTVIARLMDPRSRRQQGVKALFLFLGLTLVAVAAAGPRWGQQFQEVHRRGVDVMIALDLSASMWAEDVKPNRLTQAKRELSVLINRLEGDRVGLVAFAGTAFLQCPLTLDYGAARSLLELLNPDLIPKPGTNLASAITTSLEAFPRASGHNRALVLLTDGEDHSGQLDTALDRAVTEGLRIFTIGFGNPAGEIIPIRDENGQVTGYKKDKNGQTVLSKMDEGALKKLAAKTGGAYFPASQGEVEVTKIIEEIGRMDKKDLDSRVYGQGENHYRWPLGFGLLLLLLEFLWPEVQRHWRRVFQDIRSGRFLLLLLAGGVICLPVRSQALGRYPRSTEIAPLVQQDPKNPEAQFKLGQTLFIEQSYAAAAEAFEKAATLFDQPAWKSAAFYNAGNAHYRQGRLDDAIEKYKQALRLVPSDPDAKHNLELAKKLDKKQKEEQKNQGKPQDQKGEPKPKPGQMSKEDAQRLLEALAQQEKSAKEKADKKKPEPTSGEDW